MFDSIFSTFWGDSASYISSIDRAVPESLTTLIAVILRDYTNGVFIFNFQIFLGFFITFAFSYYVGVKTFGNKLSAIFLALIVTFAPLRIRYSMEWAVLTFWGYYLLFFYSIFKFIKTNGKTALLLAGISFSLAFMEQPYIGVILTLVAGTSTLIFVLIMKNKSYINRLLILYGILIIFGIPGINNVYKQRYLNEIYPDVNFTMAERSESNRWAYSARPWNYLIPDINNPFLGDFAVKANYWIWDHPPYYLTEPFFPKEHTLYLGVTLLILSTLTLYLTFIKRHRFFIKHRDQTIFFLIITIVAFIFSMPPYIAYNGFFFYFPGHLLYEYLPQFRAYARFGAVVFTGVALLSTTSFTYLLQSETKNKFRFPFLSIILILTAIEFSTPYFSDKISSNPTGPYLWLSRQDGNFSYLEIPRRIDYTDMIYRKYHDKKVLNLYLQTPEYIAEIEKNITLDIGNSKDLLCNRFRSELNGNFIMYHDKEVYKETVVNEFKRTGKIIPQLKIGLEESWGEPAWGNHVPKSEEDLRKIANRRELLQKLRNDDRFTVVKEFKREEPVTGENYNANNLDEVTVFRINPGYCD